MLPGQCCIRQSTKRISHCVTKLRSQKQCWILDLARSQNLCSLCSHHRTWLSMQTFKRTSSCGSSRAKSIFHKNLVRGGSHRNHSSPSQRRELSVLAISSSSINSIIHCCFLAKHAGCTNSKNTTTTYHWKFGSGEHGSSLDRTKSAKRCFQVLCTIWKLKVKRELQEQERTKSLLNIV